MTLQPILADSEKQDKKSDETRRRKEKKDVFKFKMSILSSPAVGDAIFSSLGVAFNERVFISKYGGVGAQIFRQGTRVLVPTLFAVDFSLSL